MSLLRHHIRMLGLQPNALFPSEEQKLEAQKRAERLRLNKKHQEKRTIHRRTDKSTAAY